MLCQFTYHRTLQSQQPNKEFRIYGPFNSAQKKQLESDRLIGQLSEEYFVYLAEITRRCIIKIPSVTIYSYIKINSFTTTVLQKVPLKCSKFFPDAKQKLLTKAIYNINMVLWSIYVQTQAIRGGRILQKLQLLCRKQEQSPKGLYPHLSYSRFRNYYFFHIRYASKILAVFFA